MLDYTYVGKGTCIGNEGHNHRAFYVHDGETNVSHGVEVIYPDGQTTIQFFNYLKEYQHELQELFTGIGVIKEITFR